MGFSLGVGEDGCLDKGLAGLGLGLGANDAGPHAAPLGVHANVRESGPPVLILLHATPVRLERIFASLDLVGDFGGDPVHEDVVGCDFDLFDVGFLLLFLVRLELSSKFCKHFFFFFLSL